MGYRTILASLNELSQVRCILNAAASVARKQDAYVVGLYVIPAIELRPSSAVDVPPVENDSLHKYFKEQKHLFRAAFENVILNGGIRGEFRVVDAPDPHIASTVIEQSREVDLVIVGHSNLASSHAIGSHFAEQVLVSSGRPTLVIPPNGNGAISASLVLIGWNGSREAARAVFDSMPLLKSAKEVLIAWAGPRSEEGANKGARAIELVRTLSRHGIDAQATDLDSSRDAGQVLLERAEMGGAGLLVMGAYGHSRLREFILGGATRSVLRGMKIPVLFSH